MNLMKFDKKLDIARYLIFISEEFKENAFKRIFGKLHKHTTRISIT